MSTHFGLNPYHYGMSGGDDLRAFETAYDQIASEHDRQDQIQTWYKFWGTVSDDFSAMKTFMSQTVHFLTAGHIFEGSLANDLYESLGYGTNSVGTWTAVLADPTPNIKKALHDAWYRVDDTYDRAKNYASALGSNPSPAKAANYARKIGQLRDDLQDTFDTLKADFFAPLATARQWEGPGGSKDIGSRPPSENATRAVATTPLLNYAREFDTAGQQGQLPVDSRYSENDGPLSGSAWAASRTAATRATAVSLDMHQGLAKTAKALRDYVSGLTSGDRRGEQEIEDLVHGRSSGPLGLIHEGLAFLVGQATDAEAKARPIVDTVLHKAEVAKDIAIEKVRRDLADAPSVLSRLERMVEGKGAG